LPEKTCKEIIQLFSDDLTATQIAAVTGVSRITINHYLKLIRTHITRHCEHQHPGYADKDDRLIVSFAKIPGEDPGTPEDESVKIYYGFYKVNGNVFVDELSHIDKSGIYEMQCEKTQHSAAPNGGNDLRKYHAIGDFDAWRLYRIDNYYLNGRAPSDEISVFWKNAKSRLLKFRGLNKNTLYLHVKECEFRYNNRNNDINHILLNIIYQHPLHLSKAYL
jgi:transposase